MLTRQWNKTQYFIDCGINFVHQSLKVTIRDSVLPGSEWPAEFNIAGLPEECTQIKAAYIWWTASYRDETDSIAIVLVNNPMDAKTYYNSKIIGSDIGKCWNDFGEKGTRAYRADITKSITGNGKYEIGINKSAAEIDGLTLLVIYRDLKAAYQGSLFISDGLITMQRKDTNVTLNDIYVCDTSLPGSAKALLVISDLQAGKTDSNTIIEINGAPYNIKRKFWNSEVLPTGKSVPGTKSVDFKVHTDDDCYSLVMNGYYFQEGEKCRLCPERLKISLEEDTNNVCEGTVVTIKARGAPRYTWSDINGVFSRDSIVRVTPPKGGMFYNVKATSEDGCLEGSYSILINVYERPAANAGKDTTICRGSFVKLGVPKQNTYQYNWFPENGLSSAYISNPVASPDSTTVYILRAANNFGCEDYDTVVVNVVPSLVVNHPDIIYSCPGKPFTLDANVSEGTKPYIYRWEPEGLFNNPAEPFQEISLLKSQQVYLTVTDSKGCSIKDTFFIEISTDFKASAGSDTVICHGGSTLLSGLIEGGEPPYEILWAPDDGLSAANILQPVASPRETTTYYLSISDSRICYAFDTVKIIVANPLVTDYHDTVTSCQDVAASINGSVTGGIAPYKYYWEPSNGLSSDTIAEPYVISSKSVKYYLTITDSIGCTAYDTVYLNIDENPMFDLGSNIEICRGNEVEIGTLVTGGAPPYVIEWQPSSGLGRIDSNYTTASPQAATKYYMKATDIKGCSFTDSITVIVREAPVPGITVGAGTLLCPCDSLLIVCTGDYNSYIWQDGLKTKAVYAKTPGEYYVTVVDSNGCTGVSNTIKIESYNSEVKIELPEKTETKTGETVALPMKISYTDDLGKCGRLELSGMLAVNKTVLLPVQPTPIGYTEGNKRIIPFSGKINMSGESDFVFHFTTALGNAPASDIEVVNLKFGGCEYEYYLESSVVSIADVCFEGGNPRLFLPGGLPLITSYYPVPSNEKLYLNVYSAERSKFTLLVNNLLGRAVLEKSLETEVGNNSFVIDLQGLPPGCYLLCTRGCVDDYCREIIIVK